MRISEIEKIVNITFNKLNLQDTDNIDIVNVANMLGYEVYEVEFKDDISGMLVIKNKAIYINRNDRFTRQRFTIAHEIGHIILHGEDDDVVCFRNSGKYDTKEFEADNFAAMFLMPAKKCYVVWEQVKYDIDDFAYELAVSKKAAAIRLMNLGLIE